MGGVEPGGEVVLADEERLERERAFHDERFGDEMSRDAQEKYYWAVKDGRVAYDSRIRELAKGADVLEYGCATGDVSLALAPFAKSVTGIDISGVAIDKANANAPDNASFHVMNAEAMDFEDNSFDMLFGSGIVHHLDVERCAKEVNRVLRPGGRALFWEPLGHNVAINFYRRLTPAARTEDEHPLVRGDFRTLSDVFGDLKIHHYGLFTLGGVPFRNSAIGKPLFALGRAADRAVFSMPGLKWQSWYTFIECRKAS